ncbi:carbohydrate-binding protein [Agromyces sp. Root81]|uniref:DUF4185 domain-containing protein n=1 Tax=Agromyces sp. Root81 TaxID=1736601 RepID=UPI0006F31E63|nr:DUF4185 domain-containing protein [Agromyces sp. Root81]KRC61807.1 carbohydrate-binding protein [Agromyces sp. Root81]
MQPVRRTSAILAAVGALVVGVIAPISAAAAPLASAESATAEPSVDHSPAVLVSKMTGPKSLSATDTRWAVTGTDLGIMWDNGSGEILTAFGDTFGDWNGPGGGGGDWRSNVLLRSSDADLADGMTFDSAVEDAPGHAGEIIPSLKINGQEMTTIPTAGIAVGDRQYLAFMSVRQWGAPGAWDTNFSRIAYSDDNGETWNSTDGPEWANSADGRHPFQMVAFERHDGFVYMFGTPNGRFGAVHVARVPEASVLDKSAYSYWNGSSWVVGDDTVAAPIVPPNAAELSVQYSEHTGGWLMTYLNEDLDLVLRTAPAAEGPWGEAQRLASFADYPGLYGGYLHPWSDGGELYFALSQWEPYNVYLMRAEIDETGAVVNPNLIEDPGFERAVDGAMPAPWACTGNCGIDVNHAWANGGTKQGWMRHNAGWIDIHQDVAVEPNTTYTFTGFVVTGGAPAPGSIGVRELGAGGSTLAEASFESVGAYTRYSVTFHSGDRTAVQAFVGTNLNGDRWVQIDDLSLVKAREQLPALTVTASSDPVAGSEVVRDDVVTFEVQASTDSASPEAVALAVDLAGLVDDATLDAASVRSSIGEPVLDGSTLRWSGEIEPGETLDLGFAATVRRDASRGDSELVVTTTAEAERAILTSCAGCLLSLSAVHYDPRPPRPEFPDKPGKPERPGKPDRP